MRLFCVVRIVCIPWQAQNGDMPNDAEEHVVSRERQSSGHAVAGQLHLVAQATL